MNEVATAAARLTSTGLAGRSWRDLAEVVHRFGAVQAQEFSPALWSLRQRLGSGVEAELVAAFDAGTILRTHVLRPTWHFVLPSDIRWLEVLTAPRVQAFNLYYYRRHELDEHLLGRCVELIGDALAEHGPRTRAELTDVLAEGGVPASGLRLGLILMHAELERVMCSGPRRGTKHTYALFDERVPPTAALTGDEALAELAARYFASHGPATVKDFAWWSSLTIAQCRRAVEAAGDRVESRESGGVEYWAGPALPAPAAPSGAVQLLQPYDEYVVAYSESKNVVDIAGRGALRPEHGAFNNVVIRGTQFAGFWKRTLARASVTVEVQLYEPFDGEAMAALRAAVDEHARYVGRLGVLAEPAYVVR